MANHIVNTIIVRFEKNKQELAQRLFDSMNGAGRLDALYESPQDTRGWWETHIGAKWARLQDMEVSDGEFYLNIESAWHEIEPFVNRLNELFEDECEIRHEWVDEMPTWFGFRLYEQGRCSHEFIRELTEEELQQEYRDNHDGAEPTEDAMWDWMWDWCYDQIGE